MPPQFSIWIVTPPGYGHSRCFEEVALGLQAAFAELGFDAPVVTDPTQARGHTIALGPHLLPGLPKDRLPPHLILYNMEQMQQDSPWFVPEYIDLLRRYPVWDYSPLNIEKLKAAGVDHAALCGIGYMPALTRIAPGTEDIDVLFVGSRDKRRMTVLREIARHGKVVTAVFDRYGTERDALIARARLLLNLHCYEAKVFEIVRVSYLLANRKCVVSEIGSDAALEEPLRAGIAFASYENLAAVCLRLLDQLDERATLAARGFECFSGLSQVQMLKAALAAVFHGPTG
jgi:hypothetical protein